MWLMRHGTKAPSALLWQLRQANLRLSPVVNANIMLCVICLSHSASRIAPNSNCIQILGVNYESQEVFNCPNVSC